MKPKSLVIIFFCQHGTAAFEDCYNSTATQSTRISIRLFYVPASLCITTIPGNDYCWEYLQKGISAERNELIYGVRAHIEENLQYPWLKGIYGHDALRVRFATALKNCYVIFLKGNAIAFGTAALLGKATHTLRPNSCLYTYSLSGHMNPTFPAEIFLKEQYQNRYQWMRYASYGLTSCLRLFRMAND